MSNSRTINLAERVKSIGSVRFLRAEVAEEEGSQFATVYYSIEKREEPLGLRLDLSKRRFLDTTGVSAVDAELADVASLITDVITAKAGLQVGYSVRPFDLREQFELDGLFWLPDDEVSQSEGTLVYTPGERIVLTLYRELRPKNDPRLLSSGEVYPLIVARFVDGTFATLIDCFPTKWHGGPGGRGKVEIMVNRCILNAHVSHLDALKFKGCRVRLTSLEEWLSLQFVEIEMGGRSDTDILPLTVKYDRPVPMMLDIPTEDCQLLIQSGMHFDQSPVKFSMHKVVTLQIQYGHEKPLDDWLDVSWSLQLLFSLFAGEPVAVREELLEVTIDNTNPAETVTCPFVAVQRVRSTNDHLFPTEMLLPWPEIASNAAEVFDKWFQLMKTARQAIAAFFETIFVPETPNHLKFLSVATAIEIYARTAIVRMGQSEEKMPDLFMTLADVLPVETRNAIVGDTAKFFERVILTRNYFSHGVMTGEAKPMDGAALHYATEKLKVLFFAALLAEIGVPKPQLLNILRKKPWMRWAMGIPLD